MSIFGSIMHKIFHHDTGQAPASGPTPDSAAPAATPDTTSAPAPSAATTPAASTPAAAPVDVAAVCSEMATQKGGGGNWQTSIVDLLKLLDLDSSLDSRKQLADELNVHTGAPGTPEENIALHKAVMQKLAENGGKVPDSMRA